MWGLIPAAGAGSRISPLAFSKELLPVGSRWVEGREQPRAVSEYIVERMLAAGVTRICFIIAPGKSDILEYFGSAACGAELCYVVQPRPLGLCSAIFRAAHLLRDDDQIILGLPDTLWFPATGYQHLPPAAFSLLLFPVDEPSLFDAVVTDAAGQVKEVQVKSAAAASKWIWGGMRMRGVHYRRLHELFKARGQRDEYLGTLLNSYLAEGGQIQGIRAGGEYVDVGTASGFRRAIDLLRTHEPALAVPQFHPAALEVRTHD